MDDGYFLKAPFDRMVMKIRYSVFKVEFNLTLKQVKITFGHQLDNLVVAQLISRGFSNLYSRN